MNIRYTLVALMTAMAAGNMQAMQNTQTESEKRGCFDRILQRPLVKKLLFTKSDKMDEITPLTALSVGAMGIIYTLAVKPAIAFAGVVFSINTYGYLRSRSKRVAKAIELSNTQEVMKDMAAKQAEDRNIVAASIARQEAAKREEVQLSLQAAAKRQIKEQSSQQDPSQVAVDIMPGVANQSNTNTPERTIETTTDDSDDSQHGENDNKR